MGRPRPLQRLLTTNRLSRGISGSAKVHIGAAGGRGGRALRALPGPAPPERPSRSAGGLGSRAGVLPLRPGLWPFLLRPFHVGPRASGHVGGDASPGGPGRSAPEWPWPHRAPARPAAPTYPLPGPAAPTSSWASARAASAFSGPRGQARASRRGHLLSPNPDQGDGARAWAERRRWLRVRGEGALCAGTCSGCVPYEKQNIFTHWKKMFLLPGSRSGYF